MFQWFYQSYDALSNKSKMIFLCKYQLKRMNCDILFETRNVFGIRGKLKREQKEHNEKKQKIIRGK